ncbi:MAG: amidohydrolase, partial [Planctomycetes bacterium]|nr:amidohydrolase [Planctomycetota bacterium]
SVGRSRSGFALLALTVLMAVGCRGVAAPRDADELLIVNGRVYTMSWGEPGRDGTPAPDAPRDAGGWHPDAEAVWIRDGVVAFVGDTATARARASASARVLDADGATVLPGLIESHAHVAELGRNLRSVDLVGARDEAEAVERVRRHAAAVPTGEWILGHGWDDGAWADRYPTAASLSAAVPDHPVVLVGLHGFAVWGNDRALRAAGITRDTAAPRGGEILRDAAGEPTGVLLNRATPLLTEAPPQPGLAQRQAELLAGLGSLARSGYVAAHEAGVPGPTLAALEGLAADGRLPLRVYAMLSARDPEVCARGLLRGPQPENDGMLTVRSVKAYYDGALGSRGARLLEDYADLPGHRGVSGAEYQFDQQLVARMMAAGFQVAVHAIGDAGNRETLGFLERVMTAHPSARAGRHRIEHAQVVHPDDFARFAELSVIASMEPVHAMEDKAWAMLRLGPERCRGAYAWRTMREHGVRLAFNSDLPGSDHGIFYGLHSAITRRDKRLQPPGGWFPEQRMTVEEAVRGYTVWAAYAGFADRCGQLVAGHCGDVTILDIDPFVVGERDPTRLLRGKVVATVVAGDVVYAR